MAGPSFANIHALGGCVSNQEWVLAYQSAMSKFPRQTQWLGSAEEGRLAFEEEYENCGRVPLTA